MHTIPTFPEFKKLEYSDKVTIQAFTEKFSPHADFNFMGMWMFDTDEKRRISMLNGNLIVKTTHYVTGLPFFTYLGDQKVSETVEMLLDAAAQEGIEQKLSLISEDSLSGIDKEKFYLQEDRDNFDYVLDNKKMLAFEEKELRNHASFKRRFAEAHGQYASARFLDLSDAVDREKIMNLNEYWLKNKLALNKDMSMNVPEEIAIGKMFKESKDDSNIISVGLFYKENLIGYMIDESIRDDYVIRHFMKADISYKGIYSYLVSEVARLLLEINKRYVNLEQDLGFKNLRQSKESFAPVSYTKKYIITPKQ